MHATEINTYGHPDEIAEEDIRMRFILLKKEQFFSSTELQKLHNSKTGLIKHRRF